MRRKLSWAVAVVVLVALAACEPGGAAPSRAPAPAPPPPAHPLVVGSWTFYGPSQGLPPEVHDVSADEGGDVNVAGGDALYAKGKRDEAFGRFDAASAGLTENCNDPEHVLRPSARRGTSRGA